jgi:hypothetical protein
MFLQIGKRYTSLSALHLFFPTLPIIWAQVAVKRYLQNSRWWPFKIKKKMFSTPTLEQYLSFDTNFDPP